MSADPKPPAEDAGLVLARLPHGRHGLSREFVTENQRARITAATIAAVAARGYRETSVTRITTTARVARTTFYGYFAGKEECFLDTYRLIAEHLQATIAAAAPAALPWPQRVRCRLGALLETFAANPDLVRFALIWPQSAEQEIEAAHDGLLTSLLAALAEGASDVGARALGEPAGEALIGGAVTLIVRAVKAGDGARLETLEGELAEMFLTAYLGREQARRLLAARG